MAILFLVLKIIGIILLVLISFLLFVLASLLFFPCIYRVKGSVHQKAECIAKISCFYHLLGISILYRDGILKTYLRILFFKKEILKDKEETEETQQKFFVESQKEVEIQHEVGKEEKNIPSFSTKEINHTKKGKKKPKKVRPRASLLQKMRSKRIDFKENYDKYKKIFTDARNKTAFVFLKVQFIKILQIIMPKKLKMTISFSLGSPDYTGQLLGVLCLFPIGYKNRWNIYPDFENDKKYVTGVIDAKGRILLFRLLITAIKVLLDKDVKRLYKMLNK